MALKSPYLTSGEVAALYRVHLITIYRLVAAGKLRPFKVGRILRFDPGEVEQAFAPPPPLPSRPPVQRRSKHR